MTMSNCQVEQVDVCEEQNNKISIHDDYNSSIGFPEVLTINGSWIYGLNAGGSRNNLDMFETNPQYLLKFPTGDSKWHLDYEHIFMQPDGHNDCEQKETLGAEYFLCTEPEGSSGVFKAKQVISETFVVSTLRSYVIVPATFKPFQQGNATSSSVNSLSDFLSNIALCLAVIIFGSFFLIFFNSSSTSSNLPVSIAFNHRSSSLDPGLSLLFFTFFFFTPELCKVALVVRGGLKHSEIGMKLEIILYFVCEV
ncbi:hypothetical protein AGLY_001939 [Aphis glycines]|uniref:Peptidase C2 calpain domain-containing protein n=1 Tax=Aphis glycines TaxID=307491 RepID=A0A6G0U3X6_APHGL|nr:hypothetical protein AGLY_001939 [Aphis glycines]